jgi:uncharacterized membrane protein YhaH (DUF805 family)
MLYNLRAMKSYFTLSGRMRRRDFCVFWLAGLTLRVALGYFAQHTEVSPTLLGVGVIALFTPPIVRRLHDMGYSGWLSIGVIALPYASVFLLLFAGENGSNVYGPDPKQKNVGSGAGQSATVPVVTAPRS